jgi:WD40 repeat protein
LDTRHNRLAAAAEDSFVRMWDTGVERATLRFHHPEDGQRNHFQPGVRAVDFDKVLCPTQMVSGAADGSWRLWDVRQPDSVAQRVEAHASAVSSVALLGMRLMTASLDGWAKLWDIRASTEHEMQHVGGVYMLGLRPAGRGAATSSRQKEGFVLPNCGQSCGFDMCR